MHLAYFNQEDNEEDFYKKNLIRSSLFFFNRRILSLEIRLLIIERYIIRMDQIKEIRLKMEKIA